jgi:putative phosphoribosyl transferase
LLTEEEDAVYATRFNIQLLTDRLLLATRWLHKQADTKDLTIGYFGASTGAAAALKAAAALGSSIGAVVSRGGRPDLAEEALMQVQSPTLLIVGGNDKAVLHLNREAFAQLPGEKELVIVPGATHLFEEPGALEQVAREAAQWFARYLPRGSVRSA